MTTPMGRAEYLDKDTLKKANLFGEIDSYLWRDFENKKFETFPDFMLKAVPGSGKTFLIKKKLAEGSIKANYSMLDKETLKYKTTGNSEGTSVIDDINFLIEIGRYNEISGTDGFNTKDACRTLVDMYKDAKENGRSTILLSSEDIYSLSLLMNKKDQDEFLKTFGWAIDPATPFDIIQKYKKVGYIKINDNITEPSSEVIEFRKDFIIPIKTRGGLSGKELQIENYKNISKDFNIISIPSIIPHSEYHIKQYLNTEEHQFNLYARSSFEARGRLINKFDKKDFIEVKDLPFNIQYFNSNQSRKYPVGHVKYDWKMITTPRKLEIVKQTLHEISPDTLRIKPKSELTNVRIEHGVTYWGGRQVDIILHQIDKVCWEATRTEAWCQLIDDLEKASTKKDYQQAYLKSTITRQFEGA